MKFLVGFYLRCVERKHASRSFFRCNKSVAASLPQRCWVLFVCHLICWFKLFCDQLSGEVLLLLLFSLLRPPPPCSSLCFSAVCHSRSHTDTLTQNLQLTAEIFRASVRRGGFTVWDIYSLSVESRTVNTSGSNIFNLSQNALTDKWRAASEKYLMQ